MVLDRLDPIDDKVLMVGVEVDLFVDGSWPERKTWRLSVGDDIAFGWDLYDVLGRKLTGAANVAWTSTNAVIFQMDPLFRYGTAHGRDYVDFLATTPTAEYRFGFDIVRAVPELDSERALQAEQERVGARGDVGRKR